MTDTLPLTKAKLISQGWGSRLNFQLSYGLKMTPEDLKEGDEIIQAMLLNQNAASEAEADQLPSREDGMEAMPPNFDVAKTLRPRGEWQQYRLVKTTPFTCCRCQEGKKSKLVAIKNGTWSQIWCNGCYGWLLANA